MPTANDPALVSRPEVDSIGAETLERIGSATAFNRWMFQRLAPWVGPTVLEVGAGVGNISQFLVDRQRVVLSDIDPEYLKRLETRFAGKDNFGFRKLELPGANRSDDGERFSSVICLNVLEHIEDDVSSLREMARFLNDDGRLVVLVPAFPSLFGSLDVALGHYRRYTKPTLLTVFKQAGLKLLHMEYFNLAAMPGWWFTGRILERELIPAGPLDLFEKMIPLFRLERFLPWRVGQSLIAVGEVTK